MQKILTMPEACRLLRVSRPTMRHYLHTQYVKGWKLPGGHWRIDRESIMQKIEFEAAGNLNPGLDARARNLGRIARNMSGGKRRPG